MKNLKSILYTSALSLSFLFMSFATYASENTEENENFYSFSPVFSEKDGLLTVQYINNGAKDIGISIENESGIYFDEFHSSSDVIFTNTYSLENLEPGSYMFQFTSKGVFYTYEFEVN